MIEIRLPQFGMGMTDGTILKWYKAEGERIQKGEILCDIEAAKTTVEWESPESGVIGRILVKTDENVVVNTVICEINASAPAENGPGLATQQATLAKEADVPVADAGSSVAPKASPLARRHAEQNGIDLTQVNGSGPRGKIVRNDVTQALAPGPAAAPDPAPASAPDVQIEPRARKVARELGVDLTSVAGTGPTGRITAEDVQAAAEKAKAPPPPVTPKPAPATVPTEPVAEGYSDVPHNMMRRTIARRLTESKQQVPHFYVKASCRIDALLALRKEINEGAEIKVSVNDLVIRAVALALRQVPDANVSWGEKAMRRYDGVDVAVAVATSRGLITPIVRNVETKTIRQISVEVKELAARGKEGKLKSEEYQGGNTSVSNLGMFGVEEFSAILNPPQSSIFAIGAGEERIVPIDGKPAVATMMTVTISVDHRAVDGAVAAQLLSAFKNLVETPARILA